MINGKKVLAIIPARGGSQGVKDKNIRLFNNRPLIYWALDAVCPVADRVVVSTDSKKIEWSLYNYIPFVEVWRRPKKLAGNKARVMDTMQYHLRNCKERYDYVIMHHATAPLVTSEDMTKALKYAITKDADFVISVCESEGIGVCRPIPQDDYLKGWFPEDLKGLNRQEMQQTYQLDNNIYIGKWNIFYYNVDYWNTNIYAFRMPRSKCADIDTEDDFIRAEILHRRIQ